MKKWYSSLKKNDSTVEPKAATILGSILSEYDLTPIMEDTDWMDQFLPGIIPDWILAIEDAGERQMMMDMMLQV